MMPPTITRIAHSCHLIESDDATILLDPWFVDRPLYYPGEKRSMTPDQLPPLTAIVASHSHIDHCDLDPLSSLAGSVPVVGNTRVAKLARKHGFRAEVLHEWDSLSLGGIRITGIPAYHDTCPELTFILEVGDARIYFGGDTLLLPEHHHLARRFGPIDVALLPTNGLCIRPLLNRKVVMSAEDAAQLTASLQPTVVIPHHYAFDSGPVGNLLLTKKDRDPRRFASLVRKAAPNVNVRILSTGEAFTSSPRRAPANHEA